MPTAHRFIRNHLRLAIAIAAGIAVGLLLPAGFPLFFIHDRGRGPDIGCRGDEPDAAILGLSINIAAGLIGS